jgi:hypothetical protein
LDKNDYFGIGIAVERLKFVNWVDFQ